MGSNAALPVDGQSGVSSPLGQCKSQARDFNSCPGFYQVYPRLYQIRARTKGDIRKPPLGWLRLGPSIRRRLQLETTQFSFLGIWNKGCFTQHQMCSVILINGAGLELVMASH